MITPEFSGPERVRWNDWLGGFDREGGTKMAKRYPSKDPKPDSVEFELTRRRVVNLLRRVLWRVKRSEAEEQRARAKARDDNAA